MGSPSTNNGNESINATIKTYYTFRSRLDMNTFLACLIDLVRQWSHDRDPKNVNHKKFSKEPSISLKHWTAGYQWKTEAKVKQHSHFLDCYYTAAAVGVPIDSLEVINQYELQMETCNWRNFDSFSDCAFGIWKIHLRKDEINWKKGTCTCPVYFKQYMCKHTKTNLKLMTRCMKILKFRANNTI